MPNELPGNQNIRRQTLQILHADPNDDTPRNAKKMPRLGVGCGVVPQLQRCDAPVEDDHLRLLGNSGGFHEPFLDCEL